MATSKGYKGGIRGSLGLGFDFGVLATQGWWPTKRWFLDQRQKGGKYKDKEEAQTYDKD